MGLFYVQKTTHTLFKIRAGITLNSYYTYNNAGCHPTSFTAMGNSAVNFFFNAVFFFSNMNIFYIPGKCQ